MFAVFSPVRKNAKGNRFFCWCISVAVFGSSWLVLGVPQGAGATIYSPGTTLEPDCPPTESTSTCGVLPQASAGANSDITSLSGLTTPLSGGQGGTGLSSYSIGDLLFATSSSGLARITIGTSGQVLKVSGGAPVWGSDSNLGSTDLTLSAARTLTLSGNSLTLDGTRDTVFGSNGDLSVGGGLNVAGNYATPLSGSYTSVGTQNDVNFGTGTLFEFTGASNLTLTGIAGGTDGRLIQLMNNTNFNITIKDNSASSSASNLIETPGGGDLTVKPQVTIGFQYDADNSHWHVISLPASPASIDSFAFIQNGNSFGTTAVLGTNDTQSLDFRTNGVSAFTLDTSGNGTLTGSLHVNGNKIFMGTNTTGTLLVGDGTNFNPVTLSGDAAIAASGALTINYAAAQSADGATKGFLTAADWNTFNGKQAALGFTPENTTNKSTDGSLGTSDVLFPTQNAVKTYVDNKDLGLIWHNPVELVNVIADTSTAVGAPVNNDAYIINTGGAAGNWSTFAEGDLVQWQVSSWVLIKHLAVGDRFGVSFKSNTTSSGSFLAKDDYLVQITGGTAGAFTYTFEAPSNNDATFVQNTAAFYRNVAFTYSTAVGGWVQLSASSDYTFANGLQFVGTTVSLGPLTSDWNQTGAFNIATAGNINLNGGQLILPHQRHTFLIRTQRRLTSAERQHPSALELPVR